MRLELNDLQTGAYAMVRDKAPWGLLKRVAKYVGNNEPDADEQDALFAEILSRMVTEWNVKDEDGNDVPIPSKATAEQLDLVDGQIIMRIINHVRNVLAGVNTDPNSETASSTS
ncbi:hypothetical protein [Alicyclobacillus vulcanalis]|uniref:Uncharacterized protein n=1 Tax=Alicyclobacillus vulcanalis TaxID=252246 RepID=A0A1N7MR29_9BACL|nr:hypothetical protein [Alicyclobacillus vulcanalis]SIS88319.1 hypothetical protein SAMN05421799_10629 [Alicyclobacillus vulcanalis]